MIKTNNNKKNNKNKHGLLPLDENIWGEQHRGQGKKEEKKNIKKRKKQL